MKAVSIEKFDGVSEKVANEIWEKLEKNAGYQFNRSHSVEYSIITYWCMYLKTHYPAEFFAALLTTADSEDKLQSAILDAMRYNVFVVPPDINISTNRFEFRKVEGETHLVTPFNKLKGLSDKSSDAILEARQNAGGRFKTRKDLLDNVRRRNCTVKHLDILERVGAFADIESGLPSRHPDRVKDQIELMPGLVCEYVKADRYTKLSDVAMQAMNVVRGIRSCKDCPLHEEKHCIPNSGEKIKFMVITDSPNWSEVEDGKMLQGRGSNFLVAAMKNAGIKRGNGYFTSLVKVQKPKELKSFTNETLLACQKFIDEEIRVINPAVIVCLGSAATKHFFPDIKGNWSELSGRVIYNKELNTSIVLGPNPMMAAFKDEVPEILESVFRKVSEIID